MRSARLWLGILMLCVAPLSAQQSPIAQVTVPRLIRFSGILPEKAGTIGVTFSLYKDQQGGAPLWTETQNIIADATGKYTALLGLTKAEGLPINLFTSGDAQWLSVRVEGQPEQPRVLLVSVPYALKAAEAETLSGHPATEFVTNDKLTSAIAEQAQQSRFNTAPNKKNAINGVLSSTATNFTDSTINQVIGVTQNGTGKGLVATAVSNTAIYGNSTATSGSAVGVYGQSSSPGGVGLYGLASSTTGNPVALFGSTPSTGGIAIAANETATTGNTIGLQSAVYSPTGTAAVFKSKGSGKIISGQAGSSNTEVFSVDGSGNLTGAILNGLTLNITGSGQSTISQNVANRVALSVQESGSYSTAVEGLADSGTGVDGESSLADVEAFGGYFYNAAAVSPGWGLAGFSSQGYVGDILSHGLNFSPSGGAFSGPNGVLAATTSGNGDGSSGYAVTGVGNDSNGVGVAAFNYGTTGYAMYGFDEINGTNSYAGYFAGKVKATGGVSSPAFALQIDHPQDPANKTLSHAAVESPDMLNVYTGNATTDARGEIVVILPSYFESFNRDFRYQLTPIGQFAQAIVLQEIQNNRFTIKTDKPNVKVSWQVTGVRNDAFAKAHPLVAESDKPASQRGYYLHPEENGADPTLTIGGERLRQNLAEARPAPGTPRKHQSRAHLDATRPTTH